MWGLEGRPEQYVVPNSSIEDPRNLRNVSH
uniref:Uncharacterized protein n=1 Tax=Arundo donax TaxID=35708 RepID=A0A0A9DU71_ARUDO